MMQTAAETFEPQGMMFRESLAGPPATDFLVRLPSRPQQPAPVLVSVHGLARNPLQNLMFLANAADKLGAILIAPYFSKERHRGFQWLETWKGGARADLMLKTAVAQIAGAYGGDPSKLVLFGFSGGGQFCHRFAMLHPTDTVAVICVAAGWYTLPTDLPFPDGAAPAKNGTLKPDLSGFLRVPTLVAVGSRDTDRNETLNRQADIDERQGPNRLVRAQRWVAAVNGVATSRGISAPVRFAMLKGAGHSLRECVTKCKLDEIVVEFAAQQLEKMPASISR